MNPQQWLDRPHLNGVPRIHVCEPGWRWSPPPLPDYDLWCVLAGEGELWLDRQTFALSANRCFVLPPGSTPRASQNPARRLRVLYAHFDLPDGADPLPPLVGIAVRDTATLSALANRLAFIAGQVGATPSQTPTRQAEILLESLLWLLHDEKNAPSESPADALVRQVAARVQAAPGEDWAIDRQAHLAGLSRSQYGRRFQKLLGRAPAEWVIEARLTRAALLLRETTMPIGQIAGVLGYNSVFYFSRQFKQKNGVAPSALRRKE